MPAGWKCVLMFLVLGLSLLSTQGRSVEDVTFDLNGGVFVYLSRFGFYDGGTANLTLSLDDANYEALLFACTDTAWRQLYVDYVTEDVCSNTTQLVSGCHEVLLTGEGNLSFEVTGGHSTMLYFGVISCEILGTMASMDYRFLNPDGQQLSSDYAPLPKVYVSMFCLWIIPTLCWAVNWLWHRDQKSRLNRMMTLYPLAKMTWELGAAVFWHYASIYSFSEHSLIAFGLLRLVTVVMLFGVLLLISRGWTISRSTWKDLVVIAVSLLLFTVFAVVGELFNGIFGFVKIIAYFFISFLIFSFTSQTVIRLENMRDDPDADEVGDHLRGVNVIDRKQEQLRYFNGVIIVFCVLQVAIHVLGMLILINAAWLVQLLLELLDWGIFLSLIWIFRLRRTDIFYDLLGVGGAGEKTKLLTSIADEAPWAHVELEHEAGTNNPYSADPEEFAPGMAG